MPLNIFDEFALTLYIYSAVYKRYAHAEVRLFFSVLRTEVCHHREEAWSSQDLFLLTFGVTRP